MTTWTPDELSRIASADELSIQPRRTDGSLRAPTPIWVVRDGDDLYVRAYAAAAAPGSAPPGPPTPATSRPAASTGT